MKTLRGMIAMLLRDKKEEIYFAIFFLIMGLALIGAGVLSWFIWTDHLAPGNVSPSDAVGLAIFALFVGLFGAYPLLSFSLSVAEMAYDSDYSLDEFHVVLGGFGVSLIVSILLTTIFLPFGVGKTLLVSLFFSVYILPIGTIIVSVSILTILGHRERRRTADTRAQEKITATEQAKRDAEAKFKKSEASFMAAAEDFITASGVNPFKAIILASELHSQVMAEAKNEKISEGTK